MTRGLPAARGRLPSAARRAARRRRLRRPGACRRSSARIAPRLRRRSPRRRVRRRAQITSSAAGTGTRTAMPSAIVSALAVSIAPSRRERLRVAVRVRRHDADDPGREPERVARADQAADARAAADRHVDGVEVGDRAEELERVGADAGDELAARTVRRSAALRARRARRRARAPRRSRGRARSSSAPNARIAAFLSVELPCGTTIDAAHAVAPRGVGDALAVIAARRADDARRAAASRAASCASRFRPPRTLNAPVGVWFSCLTHTSQPARRASSGHAYCGVGRHRRVDVARGGFEQGERDHRPGCRGWVHFHDEAADGIAPPDRRPFSRRNAATASAPALV